MFGPSTMMESRGGGGGGRLYPSLEESFDDPLSFSSSKNTATYSPKPNSHEETSAPRANCAKPTRPPPPVLPAGSGSLTSSAGMSPSRTLRSQAPPTSFSDLGPLGVPPPLYAHEVRWFYMERGKYWHPFNGFDSLNLEDTYQVFLANERSSVSQHEVSVRGDLYEASVMEMTCKPIYWTSKETLRLLRGTWFEAVGDKWYPLEQSEATRIEDEHRDCKWRERAKADAELQAWAVSGTASNSSAAKASVVIINRLALEKFEVCWVSDKEVYWIKKDVSSQLWNKFGEKLGKGQLYGATRLFRGYKEPASREDRVPPIGHLVFTVHGIGQNMGSSDINKSTTELRETCAQVARKHFGEEWQRKRVEFLPVEWRTWLTLDKGLLTNITPHGVKMLREMFNNSAVDVMYYTSPRFGPEILDGLRFAMEKQYQKFISHHPHFHSCGGTVSVMAHSLGSVLTYDLLHQTCEGKGISHAEPSPEPEYEAFPPFHSSSGEGGGGGSPSSPVKKSSSVELQDDASVKFTCNKNAEFSDSEEMLEDRDQVDYAGAREELQGLRQRVAELEALLGVKQPKRPLSFNVEHFFAVGSPLALFIMMRDHKKMVRKGHRGAASLIPSPVCSRIHNIHHPSDPIAYRLEPLINPLYSHVKAVKMDGVGKPSREALELATGPKPEAKQEPQSSKSWIGSLLSSSVKKQSSITDTSSATKLQDCDKHLKPVERLSERIDFMLRESLTENSYLNSITAHTGYWTSQDCAMYMLLQIYKYRRTPPPRSA